MKIVYKLLIVITFIFAFNLIVNAECSYQERNELLKEAKNVNAFFDINSEKKNVERINPNSEELESIEVEDYYFILNVLNLTNNMFIKITNNYDDNEIIVNSNSLNNGVYTYKTDNTSNIITYYLTFYSTKDNCYANKITQISLKKPKENPIYYYSVCSNEYVKDSKYCQHFITNDFKGDVYDIVGELNNKVRSYENQKERKGIGFLDIVKSYWYVGIILVLFIIFIILTILHRKRKIEL